MNDEKTGLILAAFLIITIIIALTTMIYFDTKSEGNHEIRYINTTKTPTNQECQNKIELPYQTKEQKNTKLIINVEFGRTFDNTMKECHIKFTEKNITKIIKKTRECERCAIFMNTYKEFGV